MKDANEAIRLAPTYSFVFRGRANVYNDMRKYDLAVLDYDQAIRLSTERRRPLDRGKILRTQSKFDQAISNFSHALDLDKKWTSESLYKPVRVEGDPSPEWKQSIIAYKRQQLLNQSPEIWKQINPRVLQKNLTVESDNRWCALKHGRS